MCLILFSYKTVPGYNLILAANRDEFLARPTIPLSFWGKDQQILGGRDLRAGGTWLGLSRDGRFGALTNYREPQHRLSGARSRGEILSTFFEYPHDCRDYLLELEKTEVQYQGFNLLLGDTERMYYFSNRQKEVVQLQPGVYGLSNHLLDTDWPKVKRGKHLFQNVIAGINFEEELFTILCDSRQPAENQLPDTGIGREWERLLATIFIAGETYGTRSSAVLTIKDDGLIRFHERTFHHGSTISTSDVVESFNLLSDSP